ncbi:MAG: hypothetical protein ACK4TI_01895, partial [Nitrososphaerales archaeon]
DGKIIWSSVIFTLMPNYQQTIKVGAIEVPIIDITPNETFRQVALWLKERASQFSKQQTNNLDRAAK